MPKPSIKKLIAALALVAILIAGYFLFLQKPETAAADWWDDSWFYRVGLTINNSGAADSNKKIKFDINTAALITAGKMQADCGDSRFTNANGKILRYYIDAGGGACNTASTDYYVLAPTINAGATVIYHYYGNSAVINGAESAQFSEATFTPTSIDTASEERGPGPVAYWKFDEGFGQTANDSTINANNGTLGATSGVENSDPTWQTEDMCVSGKCLKFDGVDDYVNAGNDTSISDISALSVSMWVKFNHLDYTGNTGTLTGFAGKNVPDDIAPHDGWWFSYDNRNNGNDFGYTCFGNTAGGYSGGGNSFSGYTYTFTEGEWYYLAITVNSTEAKLYINGLQSGNTKSITNLDLSDINDDTIVGQLGTSGNFFNGFIDDVKIYPYARTAAQIKADYASRGTASGVSVAIGDEGKKSFSDGLVGYWKMDEASWNGTADEVVDSSGSGNDGVAACTGTCTKPTTGAGKFGNGGSFDGSDDYVDLGNDNSLHNYIAKSSFLWVKIPAFTGSFRYLVYDGYFDSPYGDIMYLSSTANTCSIYLKNTSGTAANNSFTFTPDEWTMIGFTWDGSTVRYYKDGAEIETPDVFTGTLGCSALNLFLGINREVDSWFDGSIDEVRIYNRALSPGEVRDLYNFVPGPVGWWKMDEKVSGTGQTINDSSGYGNTGTTSSANGTGMDCMVPGKVGSACEFDGVDDYIDCGLNNLPTTQGSFEAWVKPTGGYVSGGADEYIIEMGINSNDRAILYFNDDGKIRMLVANPIPGTQYAFSTGTSWSEQWYHLAGTWDSSSVELYINGVAQTSDTSSYISTPTWNRIGIRETGGSPFNGSIDDVRIYNYARTQAQIMQDYNAGKERGKPIGHWKFDEGYGTTANNSGIGGSLLNGTLTNMASPAISSSGWTDSGKMGKGLNFDGGNDYVEVGHNASLSLNDTFSISFWMKVPDQSGYPRILEKRYNYYLYKQTGVDKLNMRIYDGTTVLNADPENVYDNKWHHIVFTFDRADAVYGYKDGIQIGTEAVPVGFGTITSNDDLTIGVNVVYENYLNGTLDDIRIYNYTLTEDEVRQEYNQGALLKLGSTGTDSSGNPDDSASREYCIPGDATACNPPVGEWNFNEGAGSTVNDISGNNNTGTWNGTGSHWTPGKIGKGGNFNGSDDYVLVPDSSSLTFGAGSSVTFSVWVKSASFQSSGSKIVEKKEAGNELIAIQAYPTSNVAIFSLRDSNGIWVNKGGTTLINDNQWHHLTGVKNGNNVYIYVDGSLEGSGSASFTGNWNDGDIRVGTSVDGGARYVDGSIDQVRIYDYARTPAQIAWDYNRGKPVAHWKFDECQGGTAYDSSGNANNGTITIGATVPQTALGTCTDGLSTSAWYNGRTGKYSSAMSFDGVDDYVDCGSGSELDVQNSDFSIEAWVNSNDNSSLKVFAGKTKFTIENWGLYQSEGRFWFQMRDSVTVAYLQSDSVYSTGIWYHLVGVRHSNVLYLYVNGIEQTDTSAYSGSPDTNADKFYIGRRIADNNYNFDGLIDEVKIYNYALTAEQIKMEYNGGAVSFR